MICKCGLGHRGWEQPQKCNIELSRRAREVVNTPVAASVVAANTETTPVNTHARTGDVLTHLVHAKPTTDRHRPGYMAEYMRKRRAKIAAG